MNKLIKSSRIYSERGLIDGALEVKGSQIIRIYHKESIPNDFDGEIIDYGDYKIIPGLIEMHIHGYMGWNAMSPDKAEIEALSKSLPSTGITAYTPSNHYSDFVFDNNAAIADVIEEDKLGAKIIGIHMEGPFISLERLGSVLPSEVVKPSIEMMDKYIESSRDNIVTVTMAPEVEGGIELVDYIVSKGINVCMGHTDAKYDEAIKAIEHGAIITQKTGNCMRGMHHREMGVLGAAMLDMRIYNEVNSDLAHVNKEFNEMIYRLKGYEKLCIVADSGVMSGMKKAKYDLPDRGIYSVGPDTLLHITDGTLDGSIYSMFYGLYNWVEVMKIPMSEAVVMASLNPAKVLEIDSYKGSIKEFKDADLVVIDDEYKVIETFVEGESAYKFDDNQVYENTKMYDYLVEEF